MTNRTVLIDGDIVAYRCGFSCEHKSYHATIDGEPYTFDSKTDLNKFIKERNPKEYEYESELQVEPLSFALSTVKHMIENIQEGAKAHERMIFLSDSGGNFRKDVATIAKYKGNRDQTRKPLYIDEIHQYLREHHGAVSMPNLEADDLLADAQTTAMAAGRDTVIASIDKDLLQIPGKHYNFITGDKTNVSPLTAYKNKCIQMLTGDSTDNIPGIYGLGPVKAEKILDAVDPKEWETVVLYQWDAYLGNPDKRPDWIVSYDNARGILTYKKWDGTEATTTLTILLREIERLITVGVPNGKAYKAAEA